MNEIKRLFSAETNAMRLYFVENYTTGQAICVDWDLSDEVMFIGQKKRQYIKTNLGMLIS